MGVCVRRRGLALLQGIDFFADASGVEVTRHRWEFDRPGNKVASARAALELLLRRVEASDAT